MFNTMHLFAGAGGGLLADLILGHNPIVAVEWDKHACSVLRERTAQGWFPGLHLHEGDVRMFDPSPWAGRVDCIHAGFPCQDISVAGNGAGIDGERSGLYREVVRCIGVVKPRFVFLENSPAIVGRGLGTVLADLAACGYDARWTVLAAADVGAPHQRERWWCFAFVADASRGRQGGPEGREMEQPGRTQTVGTGQNLANPNGVWELQSQGCQSDQRGWIGDGGEVGDPVGVRLEKSQPRETGDEQPATAGANRAIGWWAAEPDVGRMAHGVAHRVDRIAAIGNGQVPLCAAAAWKILGGPMNHEATPNSMLSGNQTPSIPPNDATNPPNKQ